MADEVAGTFGPCLPAWSLDRAAEREVDLATEAFMPFSGVSLLVPKMIKVARWTTTAI